MLYERCFSQILCSSCNLQTFELDSKLLLLTYSNLCQHENELFFLSYCLYLVVGWLLVVQQAIFFNPLYLDFCFSVDKCSFLWWPVEQNNIIAIHLE